MTQAAGISGLIELPLPESRFRPNLLDVNTLLEIIDLHASVDGSEILNGITLTVNRGEVHAVMGPNGSGKSTLANVLMGHPAYTVTGGSIRYKGEELVLSDEPTPEDEARVAPNERAKKGMFLAFQYPEEIQGVTIVNFLRAALSNRTGTDLTVLELRLKVMEAMKDIGMDATFADRYLNEGFSGGERKRNEILQMAVLEPELAIMDETDSGLDIDALAAVADGVSRMRTDERGFLIITHYQRLLEYIKPDVVHILVDGAIVETGGPDLARRVEEDGYDSFRPESAAATRS
ncbi:MAG: Fe-S cluster assembly ATPase SufC [Acidimicrobiia bacterium]|nr:Fe-S cluster assembly ATPase SufC [Acidimicrobiia bacterium]NNL47595.1 Fe-S cluster assembly ATPase SufC [Acidimicrobiia bacterium]